MLVLEFVVVKDSVEPGETGFPKWRYDRSVNDGEEIGLSERMRQEERE